MQIQSPPPELASSEKKKERKKEVTSSHPFASMKKKFISRARVKPLSATCRHDHSLYRLVKLLRDGGGDGGDGDGESPETPHLSGD